MICLRDNEVIVAPPSNITFVEQCHRFCSDNLRGDGFPEGILRRQKMEEKNDNEKLAEAIEGLKKAIFDALYLEKIAHWIESAYQWTAKMLRKGWRETESKIQTDGFNAFFYANTIWWYMIIVYAILSKEDASHWPIILFAVISIIGVIIGQELLAKKRRGK